ncbi:MAG: anthranilate synthase component I family protein [Aureispira sp.]|nr:anthranilate synthase component I family protein [Aureispira sp.]
MKSVINLQVQSEQLLADMITPISIYLKLRDHFANTLLLESSEYHSRENSYSFICADAIAGFVLDNGVIQEYAPNQDTIEQSTKDVNVVEALQQFYQRLDIKDNTTTKPLNGLFGHTNFEAVQYFDTLELQTKENGPTIPTIRYHVYRFVIAIDHFSNQMQLIENIPAGESSQLPKLKALLQQNSDTTYSFERSGAVESNLDGEEFKALVTKGKAHCARGDVFQMVLSRAFQQKFKGDEFNVYRALRSINPSPYLFYFDYGSYKIFGSSPEAQLVIKDQKATLTPIAGTYKRTGLADQDKILAQQLLNDTKENAEHVMLVDLARNDLNRHSTNVAVAQYKEVHYYSHVMHLVSKVEGQLAPKANIFQTFADTFPAGTLSGAPKYRALQLIDQYENQARGFYGGAIGYFGFDGSLNQAILIRSFLSQANTLHLQAGAGIVIDSDEEKELEEINNKLAALQRALGLAEKL